MRFDQLCFSKLIFDPLVTFNPVVLLVEYGGMYQLLFFEPCYEFVTSRYDGIAFGAAINSFECKLCQMCQVRSYLFGYS